MMKGAIAVLALLLVTCTTTTFVRCEPQVPCYYIFGDSLSDVGNNNDLATKARANYPPYGIDFPGGIPTGRFSNGRNFVDRLTELLEFDEYISPFSTAKGQEILKGVNYASGAAGIRSETGQHLGERISLDQQILNHGQTISKIAGFGDVLALQNLEKCLYTVNIGSNDYINNYFSPQKYNSSSLYSPDEYAELLINQYAWQLKNLYLMGARKIAVFGLGLIGCTLGEIFTFGPDASLCVDKINAAVQPFNQKLINLVDDLTMELSGAQITYIGASENTDTGSAVADATCCKVRDDYQCTEFAAACEGRDNYIFWDGFHTTEVVNILTGETAYSALDSKYIHPVDIKTLVSCDREFMLNKVQQRISTRISSE